MAMDWQQLGNLVAGRAFTVERIRLAEPAVAIEGSFMPPPLAQLAPEDQVFVMAFVRSHGSIKQMEKLFGVSYPTIKTRLNRLSEQLPWTEIEEAGSAAANDVLAQLERGDITADQAADMLER